jgi:hypothetical protein
MARSSQLFVSIGQKLSSNKPSIRLNLLRIIGSICDATDEGGLLLDHFGLFDLIRELQVSDSAVLVRSMAQELIRSCEELDDLAIHSGGGVAVSGMVGGIGGGIGVGGVGAGGMRRLNGAGAYRRTSSSTTPPHLLERQMSMPIGPSSPQVGRSERSSTGFFDGSDGIGVGTPGRVAQTPRRARNGMGYLSGSTAIRPESRDGSSSTGTEGSGSAAVKLPIAPLQRASTTVGRIGSPPVKGITNLGEIGMAAKSRLPRGMSTGPPRMGWHSQAPTQINGSRNPGGSSPVAGSMGATASSMSRNLARDSLSVGGPRNGEVSGGGGGGGGGVDITIASTRRTTARRRLSGDGKWS